MFLLVVTTMGARAGAMIERERWRIGRRARSCEVFFNFNRA
jgi:hypothetical protein